ncbi:TonB-dependent receptor [Proteiniphilum sp.]|uniref:TonB-dependent receptor n=1 Tax=Proteiniphilum sp. TaxID=1926877 RepID=UPI003A599895
MIHKDIESFNTLSVSDAIRFFSGIQLKDYGGIGGLGSLDTRNIGTNQMNVFYDGIQLTTQNGQVNLGRFSLDNIEQISLYSGQKSEILQSAKDFGYSGAIYITSRHPKFEGEKQGNIRASLRSGSFGLFNPSMLVEYKISDDISASFSGEWINADGKYKFAYRRRNQAGTLVYDTTAVRQNGDINATRLEVGLYGLIKGGKWTIRGHNYNSEKGIPGAIINNTFRKGERLWDRNSFIQGTINKDFSPQFRSMLNIKYASDFTHYQNYDNKEYDTDSKYRQKEMYISLANLYSILDNWDISFSTDFQWNTLDAEYNIPEKEEMFPKPIRYTTLIAGATSFEFWKFKAQASTLLNLARHKVGRNENLKDKSLFTPAFFLSFKPFDGHALTLNPYFRQMFRMPTFNDLYYTDMANPYLKPEHVTQYNVGVKYEKELKIPVWRHFDIEVNGYYHDVIDKIIAYPKGNQFEWTRLNLKKVEVKGINASVGNLFEIMQEMFLNLKLQYTYEKAQDFSNPQDSYYGHQIPYIPWNTGSAMVSFKYRGWSAFYSFIYTGERYSQQENFYFNHVQPWYTNDLALTREIKIQKNHLKFSVEINNLFSQNYDVILNYPMPKTSYRFLISIEL